jgi:hypothetical protein
VRNLAAMTLVATFAVGCGGPAASMAGPTLTPVPTELATASPSPAVTKQAIDAPIVGSWHRAQTCEEMRIAFEAAGLAESHRDWLAGNFFGGEPPPATGDVCEGAAGPVEHDHFFTADGRFGSHDENGEEVDSGDFAIVDDDTLAFPSHATEFKYDGDLTVDYSIVDHVATFDVALPESCVDTCADAYAWALSAFASGPWEAGEVP